MKKLVFSFLMMLCLAFSAQAAVIDSLILLQSFSKAQVDSILTVSGIPAGIINTIYDIDIYKVRYKTVSYDSSEIFATGMLAFPTNADCKFPLSTFGHGTETIKENVPSRIANGESTIGLVVASLGYVSTLPDYIGMGDAPAGLLHMYQDAPTEASATIDLLRAAREAAPQLGYRLNGQLFITGYSQGGHTTMAAHKMIQEKLSNEFTVTASCPMSGPYDLSGVMVDVMLSDSAYPTPAYLPYLVFAWNQKYNFYSNPSEFLASPYDTLLPPKFNGLNGLGYLNSITPSVPKLIFKPDVIDSFANNPLHPFRLALKDNDVYDWLPTSPVKILFCRADKEVNWHNAETLYNAFKANGAVNVDTVCVNETLAHYDCAQFAVLGMKTFFQAMTTIDSCQTTGIKETKAYESSMFPNPTQNTLTVAGLHIGNASRIWVTDNLGRTIAVPFTGMAATIQVDVKDLANGIYFLNGELNGTNISLGRFVKQ